MIGCHDGRRSCEGFDYAEGLDRIHFCRTVQGTVQGLVGITQDKAVNQAFRIGLDCRINGDSDCT